MQIGARVRYSSPTFPGVYVLVGIDMRDGIPVCWLRHEDSGLYATAALAEIDLAGAVTMGGRLAEWIVAFIVLPIITGVVLGCVIALACGIVAGWQ